MHRDRGRRRTAMARPASRPRPRVAAGSRRPPPPGSSPPSSAAPRRTPHERWWTGRRLPWPPTRVGSAGRAPAACAAWSRRVEPRRRSHRVRLPCIYRTAPWSRVWSSYAICGYRFRSSVGCGQSRRRRCRGRLVDLACPTQAHTPVLGPAHSAALGRTGKCRAASRLDSGLPWLLGAGPWLARVIPHDTGAPGELVRRAGPAPGRFAAKEVPGGTPAHPSQEDLRLLIRRVGAVLQPQPPSYSISVGVRISVLRPAARMDAGSENIGNDWPLRHRSVWSP